jgi:hypothetical protein
MDVAEAGGFPAECAPVVYNFELNLSLNEVDE